YGCFTIIVLGESLLASANAVFGALSDVVDLIPLISLGVLSLIVTAAMWWIYFWPPHHRAISGLRGSIKYGYGHYFIFAAPAASRPRCPPRPRTTRSWGAARSIRCWRPSRSRSRSPCSSWASGCW